MNIEIGKFKLKKKGEFENEERKIVVFGECFDFPQISDFSLQCVEGVFSIDEINKLNFDGGYVVFYTDKREDREIIFRSHADEFLLFYTIVDDTMYFSDDFYCLCEKHNYLTWDRQALRDYFEISWNNICKGGRTPFLEIRVLETWKYMEKWSDGSFEKKNWKNIHEDTVYSEKNLEEFKQEFLKITDYYLHRIHNQGGKLAAAISSGIDANTLTARYSQLYPQNDAIFVTSRIDDITDESKIASYMQSRITGEISYIEIKNENVDLICELTDYIDKYVPPRKYGELHTLYFYEKLKEEKGNYTVLNGMEADGLFGDLGNEYMYLMNQLMKRKEYAKAKDVLTAKMVSFPGSGGMKSERTINRIFSVLKVLYCMGIGENVVFLSKRRMNVKNENKVNHLLKIKLPKSESRNVDSYEKALDYASKSDGALRVLCTLCNDNDIKVATPFSGYKYQVLKKQCDPYIFSNKVNKSCMRYAVKDLLPTEILDNHVKTGNPSLTISKIMEREENRKGVISYLENHDSGIVCKEKLVKKVMDADFDKTAFLALSLIVFENKIKTDLKCTIKDEE